MIYTNLNIHIIYYTSSDHYFDPGYYRIYMHCFIMLKLLSIIMHYGFSNYCFKLEYYSFVSNPMSKKDYSGCLSFLGSHKVKQDTI